MHIIGRDTEVVALYGDSQNARFRIVSCINAGAGSIGRKHKSGRLVSFSRQIYLRTDRNGSPLISDGFKPGVVDELHVIYRKFIVVGSARRFVGCKRSEHIHFLRGRACIRKGAGVACPLVCNGRIDRRLGNQVFGLVFFRLVGVFVINVAVQNRVAATCISIIAALSALKLRIEHQGVGTSCEQATINTGAIRIIIVGLIGRRSATHIYTARSQIAICFCTKNTA